MLPMFRMSLFALAASVCAVSAQAAVLSTFTDRSAFEAAAGPVTTEDFNGFTSDLSFNGVVLDLGDFSITAPNVIGTGNYIDVPPLNFETVDNTAAPLFFLWNSIARITFDAPVFAVGFDQYAFGNSGIANQSLTILGQSFLGSLFGNERTFFGVVSDTAFTELAFFSGINDAFHIDNLSYGGGAVTPQVPVPASLPLLLGGLGVLALRRRLSPAA